MHCVQKRLVFLRARPSESNFDEVRVTKKRVHCVQKRLAFLRSLPSGSNFGGAKVTKIICNFVIGNHEFILLFNFISN